jgi:uncharacterized membrane protein (UPF0127 family)
MIVRAKVAQTPLELEKGLMHVDDMDSDAGMLFIFRSARNLGFWGKNTFIPLDIAFIEENGRIAHIGAIEPHNLTMVTSKKACLMALEVNQGFFDHYGVGVGDHVEIDFGDGWRDDALVSFSKENQANSKNTNQRLAADEVVKPGVQPVGIPVNPNPQGLETEIPPDEQQDLPVVDVSDLGGILEDSFDEQDEQQVPDQNQQQTPGEEDQGAEESDQPAPVFQTPFEATEWAEKNNEVVRINYTTKHGRALIRDVEPHGKFHSKSTSKQILVTFDETVGDIRAFIVSNISSWAFTGKKFDKKFVVKA